MRLPFARRCSACMAVLALAISFSSAATEQAEPAGELTLARAVEAALAGNPDLRSSAYELARADARIRQADVRPNPEIAVDLENFAGSGATRGTDALETTLSLSQVIELGGKRRHRASVALADRDGVGVERQAQQLDLLAEVTRRFVAVAAAQERLRLEQTATELAQRTLAAIALRVEAARSPEAERSRARIALTRARVEEQQAQSKLTASRYALAALWGSRAPHFTEARADLFSLTSINSLEVLIEKLDRNPEFLRFAAEARLREAEVKLARVQARPNVTFGLGVRRLNEGGDTALVAGFSMPLPVYDRNRGNIREAELRRAQSDVERDAARVRIEALLHGLYQELVTTRLRVETLRSDALPYAQQALEQTQYGYERGRFSYLEYATAVQELLDLRAAVIDAAADYHRLLAEIERLTGEPLAADRPSQELP